jgi:hypothetical protein
MNSSESPVVSFGPLATQRDKLTRLSDRKRFSVDWHHSEGSHAVAFLADTRDCHLAKPRPCGRWFLIRKPGIALRSFWALVFEHYLERRLPSFTESRDTQCSFQLLLRMPGQVKQAINIGHRHSFWTVSDLFDFIARSNFPFPQDAKVESWPSVFDKQGWHAGLIHSNAQPIAGYAWLRNLEYGLADAVAIANVDLVVSKFLNREIFAELSEHEITAPKEMFPVVVRLHLVEKHGELLATMTSEIGLLISINVQLAHQPSPCHPKFRSGGNELKFREARCLGDAGRRLSIVQIAGQRMEDAESSGLIDGAELSLGLVFPDNDLAHA